MGRIIWSGLFCLAILCMGRSQQTATWPQIVQEVAIPSSKDGSMQPAMFFASKQATPQPLIVSLHTWSGDYRQYDPLIREVLERDYNYIHPDFRGANTQPEACGSPLVVPDIEDAIRYAIANGNVDTSEIHIVGLSGGGYATLLCYTRMKMTVKSYAAWVPISNLEDWYWETKSRALPYAAHILKATRSKGVLDAEEARSRSPFHDALTFDRAAKGRLYLYAGVHDGYTGSVPITHSLRMYNKLIEHIDGPASVHRIPESDMLELLSKRGYPEKDFGFIGGRKCHYAREFQNLSLHIFEGGHEQLDEFALSLLPIENQRQALPPWSILSIGASNEAATGSWAVQIRKQLLYGNLINYAIPGNTIGYDNLQNPRLNTLQNADSLIRLATATNDGKPFDFILIALGTNDCKAEFKEDIQMMEQNLKQLIRQIRASVLFDPARTRIVALTSPPIDHTLALSKYDGGDACVRRWNTTLKKLARTEYWLFVNTYDPLSKMSGVATYDGVHLTSEAQKLVAQKVVDSLLKAPKGN